MKVLMLSKVFLKGHPREGELTGFREKFLGGVKRHTLRANRKGYYCDGDVVSVRQWSGKPYASKQEIVKDGVRVSIIRVELDLFGENVFFHKKGATWIVHKSAMATVAMNDGLSLADFKSWMFPGGFRGFMRCMDLIYLSDFRYF